MADKTLGKELFDYLCGKVGNEKVVKARKVFFKVLDVCMNLDESLSEGISSGSKPEGLDLPGSDFDLMLMDTTNVVYTEYSRGKYCPTKFELVMDTTYTPSGFAHLKVILPANEINNKFIHISNVHLELIQNESGLLLPNTNLKEYYTRKLESQAELLVPHGPCTSTKHGTLDFVFCFRTDEWPREALKWLYRPRFHDWPPVDLISDILQEEKSVLLVPIGSKFGATEDNPLEWRISFSVAEKMLVQSFNHTQILCYAMLKIILKEVLNTKKETEQLLCSYFMKTLLFWLIEETPASVWTPDNLFKCFQACITKLSYHIKHGYLPNYFVLQNNMFAGKIMGYSQKKLLSVISNIYSEGIHFTLRTRILHDFTKAKTNNHIRTAHHDVDKAIYPLLKYLLLLSHFNSSDKSISALYHCITDYKSNLVKSLFSLVLANECILRAADTNYDFNQTNKHFYSKYTSLLPYFVLGTHFNLNGWLPLAMFFININNS